MNREDLQEKYAAEVDSLRTLLAESSHLETLRSLAAQELGRLIIDTPRRQQLLHPHKYWRDKRLQRRASQEYAAALKVAEKFFDDSPITQALMPPQTSPVTEQVLELTSELSLEQLPPGPQFSDPSLPRPDSAQLPVPHLAGSE